MGWITQQRDAEPCISRSFTTRRRELNHMWEVFLTEKADH